MDTSPGQTRQKKSFTFWHKAHNILDQCNVIVFLVLTNKVKSLKTRFLLLTIYLSLWQQM